MTQAHHSCCHNHPSGSGDGHVHAEYDPCLAQEIADLERGRVRYERLKEQSDRMLMSLNIRLDKSRLRTAVFQAENNDDGSSSETESSTSPCAQMLFVAPCGFKKLISDNRDRKVFTLVKPCDVIDDRVGKEDHPILTEFANAVRKIRIVELCPVYSVFNLPVCVCGNCTDERTKVSGSLRSILMLLKKAWSVVVTRNGGMVGMWSASDGPLEEFILRHSKK